MLIKKKKNCMEKFIEHNTVFYLDPLYIDIDILWHYLKNK